MKNISEEVVILLKSSRLSSYKIAQDTGITGQTIQNYRDGKTKPSGANLTILSKYLGINSENIDKKHLKIESKPDAVADPPVELFLCPECVNKKRVIDAQAETIASLKEQIKLLEFCLGKSRSTGSD